MSRPHRSERSYLPVGLASVGRFACGLLSVGLLVGCGGSTDGGATGEAATAGSSPSAETASWFRDATAASGVDFVHSNGATGDLLAPEIMGSGVALFDADGDGDLDLFFPNGADLAAVLSGAAPGAAESAPQDRFYRNDGTGRFTDATAASGLGDRGYGMGAAVGDVDGDGDLDLYVTRFGLDSLYRNDGAGTFEEVATGAPVDGWSSSATFCHLDGDGVLDLYVVRYVEFDPETRCTDVAGRPEYCGPDSFADAQDVLLLGRGDGTFRDATAELGIDATTGAGLGVACADFDGDGRFDLYVANDADPNQLWIRQDDGTFRDEALVRGASVNAQGLDEAGMGVAVGDLDGDADLDLFVTHLAEESNTLYRNLGGARGFEDRTQTADLAASSRASTGFGTASLDVDLDGRLDLVVVNGRVKRGPELAPVDGQDIAPAWRLYAEPALLWRGLEGGRFAPVDDPALRPLAVARGLAVGDLDGDGRDDLVISQTAGPARILLGQAPAGDTRRSVRVAPLDEVGAIDLGARVDVLLPSAGGPPERLARWALAAQSYLSSSDPRPTVGLGSQQAIEAVIVHWSDGTIERFAGSALDPAGEPGDEVTAQLDLVRGTGTAVSASGGG